MPRRPRDVRRRARLGALLPDGVRRCGCGTRSGRPGSEHGLAACGYRAIDALRLEKGYRAWATDLTPETTPDEAGLGFAVKLDKGEFIGRDALAAARDAGGPPERLVCLVLDDPRAIALGSEPVRLAGGDVVGRVTSGGYGYAVEREHRARVRARRRTPSRARGCEVDIFGDWVGGEVRAEPLYDPSGERVRA